MTTRRLKSQTAVRPATVALTSTQVRALAAPTRQEIVDALESAGPCHVASLARLLGRKPDALYHHLRRLVRVGLIAEQPRSESDRARGAVYALRVMPRLAYGPPIRPADNARVIAGAQRLAWREFSRALAAGAGVGKGPQRTLWGARAKGWVKDSAIARMNRLLAELLTIVRTGRPEPGTKAISISFILAPAATTHASATTGARRTNRSPKSVIPRTKRSSKR